MVSSSPHTGVSLSNPELNLENAQSPLLRLPDEVLQIILKHMDAGTFFASLLTSKRFLRAASSRSLLFRHLDRIPGLALGLDDLSTSDLLIFFRKRAAHSGCAAGVLANVTRYAHQPGMKSAIFIPPDVSQPGDSARLVTTQWDGVLQIYDLTQDFVRCQVELHIRPEGASQTTRYEIFKVSSSPSTRDLAVLCRQREHRQRAISARDAFIYKLVTFHRCFAKNLGYFYNSIYQESRDIKNLKEYTPTGLALASNGNACIVWKCTSELHKFKICLVRRNRKTMVCDYLMKLLHHR